LVTLPTSYRYRNLFLAGNLILLALLSTLSACKPLKTVVQTPQAVTVSPSPVVETLEAGPAPTIEATVQPKGCTETKGSVVKALLPSKLVEGGLKFRVYLPPCYHFDKDKRYPVIYLIHGQGFNDDQWERIGAPGTADKLIAEGLKPFIIVMPYDKYHYKFPSTDPFDESVETELIPYVDKIYRTIADRDHRAIGGLSRGGGWAIFFSLTRPDLFSIIGGHSPAVFDEDASNIIKWMGELKPDQPMRYFIDVGEGDGLRDSAAWFEFELTDHKIPHVWRLYTGYHNEEYWSKHIEEYLRWYIESWQ